MNSGLKEELYLQLGNVSSMVQELDPFRRWFINNMLELESMRDDPAFLEAVFEIENLNYMYEDDEIEAEEFLADLQGVRSFLLQIAQDRSDTRFFAQQGNVFELCVESTAREVASLTWGVVQRSFGALSERSESSISTSSGTFAISASLT